MKSTAATCNVLSILYDPNAVRTLQDGKAFGTEVTNMCKDARLN